MFLTVGPTKEAFVSELGTARAEGVLTRPCVPRRGRGGSRVFTMLNFELHAKGNRLVGMAGTAVFAAAMLYISLGGESGKAKESADADGRRGKSEELSD